MHTSILISTLLGAGALAFPQHKHAHLHEKKDVEFLTQWQEGPYTLIQEYINEPATTSAAVAVKADYAIPQGGQHSWVPGAGNQWQHPAAPLTTAPAPVITPAVSSTPSVPVDSPPVSSSSAVPASSGNDDPSSSTGACNPTGGEAWYSPPCTGSSGASALDKINNLRKTWNSSLAEYQWDTGLAQNAYDTAWLSTTWTSGKDSNGNPTETPNGEGGGWVMGHHLFNGSNGQCIAEGNNTKSNGNLTPIESMFLMWICEKPNSAIQAMCATIDSTKGDPNCYCADIEKDCSCGHAMIIQDTGMNKIGCYFLDASEDNKKDNAVNDLETSQELGTKNNGAPGMLTCDFTG